MSTPYVGEIRLLPYMRGAPDGWHVCDGSLLPISGNDQLAALLGTTYGGDGGSNFGVPDLRGRVPVHQGQGNGLSNRPLGSSGGSESVSLSYPQMGAHNHYMLASLTVGTSNNPAGNVLAAIPGALGEGFYATETSSSAPLPTDTLQPAGSGNAHDNTAPTLTLQYCIATTGYWPVQP